MKLSRRTATLGTLGALAAATANRAFGLEWDGPISRAAEGLDEFFLATDAYIFGYPLVTMEMTRRVMTNVARPEGTRAPMGRFVRMRQYPNASFRDVTAPNADTLYTTAWVDVGKEPWILSIPDMKDRYFLVPMLDGWTNVFAVPGQRTTGTAAQTYAITGPGWTGTLPAGVEAYKSPTDLVWILGRIYCTGTPEDYAAVHALQDAFALVPASSYGKSYTPPAGTIDTAIDMTTAVRRQVNALDAVSYFTLLCALMKTNPPAGADARELAEFETIGIVPGKDFDATKFDPDLATRIPQASFDRIVAQIKLDTQITHHDGWVYTTKTGDYGTDYLMRAFITAFGLGANRPQDAIYPLSRTDKDGNPYDGRHQYVLRFATGQLPPVRGFWSLTMYDNEFFFVANPLDRYSISPRQDLKPNSDGSVDIYIQKHAPGPDKIANWLPAPDGKFQLMLRMYWPKDGAPSILDGSWTVPPVEKVG